MHHFIYDYMAPYWEKRFVRNSYACREGKGPLRASEDLSDFIRRHGRGGGGPLHYLKLDIQNFFPTIDLNILYRLIEDHLENPLYQWLCRVVIFHRAIVRGNFALTSPKELWQLLPRYKSLFAAPDGRGLPIGNLTSQFFANIYLNEIDQHIKHHLKGRYLYWQRYVDDIVFLSDDPSSLRELIPLVRGFLQEKLALTLNEKKTLLQPLSAGLDHLGYFHKPTYRLIRGRVVKSCKAKIAELAREKTDPASVCASLNSYMGYFRYGKTRGLRGRVGDLLGQSENLGSKVELDASATKLRLIKDTAVPQQRAAAEYRFRQEFERGFAATVDPGDHKELRGIKRRTQWYLRGWRPLSDLLEAGEERFRDFPAGHAVPSPDFRRARPRPRR